MLDMWEFMFVLYIAMGTIRILKAYAKYVRKCHDNTRSR
jgi:hypothetical protein